jgi:hypothetical protein
LKNHGATLTREHFTTCRNPNWQALEALRKRRATVSMVRVGGTGQQAPAGFTIDGVQFVGIQPSAPLIGLTRPLLRKLIKRHGPNLTKEHFAGCEPQPDWSAIEAHRKQQPRSPQP